MSTYIGPEEMIFNNDLNQGIHSGGFSVNSMMMKYGISPITTLNNFSSQKGGTKTVSQFFNNLVVPNWALASSGGSKKQDLSYESDDEVIDDELHDKLLELVKQHDKGKNEKNEKNEKKKKNTRKNEKNEKNDKNEKNEKNVKKKKTRKNEKS